ncbi:MAG: Stress responsive Barrel Domain, partial [Nocardioides sp.]|nr:Stress responsive Barrel Domain [Nocardioides sp.]
DDLERYSTAPFHMEIVDQLLPMVSGRVVVDFEVDA